ncbi:threonine-phosphate decarboxylase [Nitratireductor aquimarinus]|uniref:threonine-phosphate decarboxylase CobD n=1 Tax=Nitratireductor TaxID=245876 RepID=UPI0019D378D7|nr:MULTISPECIES: threonine-phosphate decarboxylase CobD [Nitratireductor]MBN7778395.1 threonine-phosphate decarboxylase [Nitratireductor pacificus]MBN7782717.1 threonine-phosphate decarboxylase [Nitratireductor pacificus]MBN7791524.1 threonine-phosphate decarboxylase [Nitratireductor aquimarinus]MBY6100782.1 threonine-phosphate decarboxylase CobD [Nitratireductor aquimarinus]MCA1262618.1 threonine-phosphate decarboxylase CobD [Nitratireductor aquimarinus]
MDIRPRLADRAAEKVTDHGGSLVRASAQFPDAPTPWLDLSTGINPHPYPFSPLPASAVERLPEEADIAALTAHAARHYGAPSAANVIAAPGTQLLLPLVASLLAPGPARILGPTYAEHARAAALAGHAVEEVESFDALRGARLAVVVNPNNPDGRLIGRSDLLDLAASMRGNGGVLVVDEAFMDVGPQAESLAGDLEAGNILVLRSFGKFFGLAGLRLGFALTSTERAQKLSGWLGPWAVAGPALHAGLEALADRGWQSAMRQRLATERLRLDALFHEKGLTIAGGTDLFRFLRHPRAADLFDHLGRSGILVRRFAGRPDCLRIGLPGDDEAFERVRAALQSRDGGGA